MIIAFGSVSTVYSCFLESSTHLKDELLRPRMFSDLFHDSENQKLIFNFNPWIVNNVFSYIFSQLCCKFTFWCFIREIVFSNNNLIIFQPSQVDCDEFGKSIFWISIFNLNDLRNDVYMQDLSNMTVCCFSALLHVASGFFFIDYSEEQVISKSWSLLND